MKKYSVLIALLVGLTGCVHYVSVVTVAPGSETVRIVGAGQEQTVSACKVVGPAEISVMPTLDTKQFAPIIKDNIQLLKNYTFAVGGDTYLITYMGNWNVNVKAHGIVYNCNGVDRRF